MNNEQLAREHRKRRRLERLGTNNPACTICGETESLCLELHHIAQHGYGDDTVIVCRNCHRKLSDKQKDHPAPVSNAPSMVECIAHFLLGLADFLILLASKLREHGLYLIEEACKSFNNSKEVSNVDQSK